MTKKKNKKIVCGAISATDIQNIQKPRFNAFAGGYGIHGDTKYNRNKAKKVFQREINEQ